MPSTHTHPKKPDSPPSTSEKWTPERLLSELPWERVEDAVGKYLTATTEAEECLRNVVVATQTWLPEDTTGKLLSVEREYVGDGMKGIADLVVLEKADHVLIVDWKTRLGKLDAAWARRLRNSWQGPWYGALVPYPGPKVVEFRGVSRGGHTRVVRRELFAGDLATVAEDAATTRELRRISVAKHPIRRGGWACYAFGRECPERPQRCNEAWNATGEEIAELVAAPMSPTSAERVWNCPHRNSLYQLDRLRGRTRDERAGDAATYGQAFHAGIAVVYEAVMGTEGE